MKKYLILFLSLTLFIACKEKKADKDNRLYLKEIKTSNKRMIWFYYSLVGSTTADYVLLYDKKGRVDTIVKSTNIKDVNFSKNIITLVFYGKPAIYDKSVILKKQVNGLNIRIDTTAISNGPTFRKFYKKNDKGILY